MATYRLAVIVRNSISSDDFLVIKQASPSSPDVEYEQFVDSDLWDLPSIELKSGDEGKERYDISISGADSVSDKINLSSFSVGLAINQISKQAGLDMKVKNWVFDKFVEEAEFGPGPPIHTIFIAGSLDKEMDNMPDALLLDPGCCKESHSKLADLVAALPRKLVVFVTHHHPDHTDGLSVVQKCNPDSILLAHESTMNRINKDTWSLGYTAITGGEKIRIRGEILEALFAPGHTDGHLALLHVGTNSLIVGDHCVGQGSAILDVRAGGNMKDYFSTTYRFLDLSPHVLIPMHGRINLWPKRMLCGYIKNRKAREASILKAIESGAQTLFEITAKTYADVDSKLWLPASSNVRIHVDHLAYQEKLPKEFSMKKFQSSCHLRFICRWTWLYLTRCKISYTKALAIFGGVGVVLALSHTQIHK